MPVQINEIIVRANIVEKAEKPVSANKAPEESADKDEIIKECTEKILEILKSKIER